MAKKPEVVKVKSAIEQIQADKKLRQFKKRLKQGIFNIDTKRMMFDINNMHKGRLSRSLKTKDLIVIFKTCLLKLIYKILPIVAVLWIFGCNALRRWKNSINIYR